MQYTDKERAEWAFWQILAPLRPTAAQMDRLLAVADAHRIAAVLAHAAEVTGPGPRGLARTACATDISQARRRLRRTGTATAWPS